MGLSPMMRIRIPPTMNAATTAISGNKSSRRSFIGFSDLNLVLDLVPASHQQTNLFNTRNLRVNFANNPPLVNDQQTIRQRRHFFELGRDEQDRATRIAQAN